jgi:hypothetical protein
VRWLNRRKGMTGKVAIRYSTKTNKTRRAMPKIRRQRMMGLFQGWEMPPNSRARRKRITPVTMQDVPGESQFGLGDTKRLLYLGIRWRILRN